MIRARPRTPPGASGERALVTRTVTVATVVLVGSLARPGPARAADEPSRPTATTAMPSDGPPGPPPEATPMGARARERYEEGLRLYGARDFTAAIRLFEEGFAIEPRREFVFAEAQAYRLAGDCGRAVPLYQRFLETSPSPIQVDATRLGLDRCAKQEAAAAAAKSTASSPRTSTSAAGTPPPPPPSPPPKAERRPWWQDPYGLAAGGAGVAALGVGLGYWVASNRARDEANSTSTPNVIVYDRLYDTAVNRRAVAIAALATGAAALAGGVARLLFVRHRDRASDELGPVPGIALAPAVGGATLLWQGRY